MLGERFMKTSSAGRAARRLVQLALLRCAAAAATTSSKSGCEGSEHLGKKRVSVYDFRFEKAGVRQELLV